VFARIVTYTADPSPRLRSATVADIEYGLRRAWERLPGVRQLEGLESAYFFVDRQRGNAIFISLWESEEAMNNSEEVMRPLRAEVSGTFAANRVDVEHYEVGDVLVQEIRERELLEHELEVARSIQQASLPKEVPTLEGWQIAPYYQPAREVGGDFYDFHLLSEDRLGVVVGDATGKGVPAALVMSTTCGMLQLATGAFGSPSPGRCSLGSMRRCRPASPPTRLSPASTPSSSLRAAPSDTPTQATTCPICTVTVRQRS
jgi:hypothetical protein